MIDIRGVLPSAFTEVELNDYLAKQWENMTLKKNDKLLCTMAQKRCIRHFCSPVPLKRTVLDRLLFRTRYTNGDLKWSGYNPNNQIYVYLSDFGSLEIEAKR